MKRELEDGYELDDDPDRVDLDVVCDFLANEAYWSKGRSRSLIEKTFREAARVVGLYATDANRQLPKNVLPAKVGEELLAAMLDRDTVRLMVAGAQHQPAFQARAVGHIQALLQSPYLFSPSSPVAASMLRLKQQLLIAGTPPAASPPSA